VTGAVDHFPVSEFACHDEARTPYPTEWVDTRLARLKAGVLVPLRARYGRPLRIVSGFRTVAWNQHVGGKPHSYHLTGEAADVAPLVTPTFGVDLVELHGMVLVMVAGGELPALGGLGWYPGRWLHFDVRQRPGRLVTWIGHGIGDEVVT
jgi:uncharacterized protein YcbK (DUF882 family)